MVNSKETIKRLQKKARMSDADINKIYKKAEKEMIARGFEGDRLEKMTIARIQAYLKKRFIPQKGSKFTGFMMGRQRSFDFAENARNKLLETMKRAGLNEAVKKGISTKDGQALDGTQEELDAFIKEKGYDYGVANGMIDSAGNLLYLTPDFKRGNILPDHEFLSTAYFILKEGDNDYKVETVNLVGEAAVTVIPPETPCDTDKYCFGPVPNEVTVPTEIPLFKEVEMYGSRKKNGEINVYKAPVQIADEFVDFDDYEEILQKAYPDKVLSSLSEIEMLNLSGNRPWGLIEANVVGISLTQNGDTVIDVDDLSLQVSDSGDVSLIRIWFDSSIKVDLADDALGVRFLISTYSKADGSIGVNGLGFYADSVWRQAPVELEDDEMPGSSADEVW